MWGTRLGSPAAMDELERDLIKHGFIRVPDETAGDNLQAKQFRRRLKRPPVLRPDLIEYSILWRE